MRFEKGVSQHQPLSLGMSKIPASRCVFSLDVLQRIESCHVFHFHESTEDLRFNFDILDQHHEGVKYRHKSHGHICHELSAPRLCHPILNPKLWSVCERKDDKLQPEDTDARICVCDVSDWQHVSESAHIVSNVATQPSLCPRDEVYGRKQ